MVDYIKHNGSCENGGGFTLYDDDASTTIWFEFYEHSIDIDEDRAIYINDDETYVGHGAGDNIGAGTDNTLVGHDAGQANNFSGCAFFGYQAGKNNTQDNVVAVGKNALFFNEGVHNVGVGCAALDDALIGGYNTGIGNEALGDNGAGSNNTSCGYYSLRTNVGGVNNTGIGSNAGGNAAVGLNNCTYVGMYAGQNNTQHNIVATGYSALKNNTGAQNTAVGCNCLDAVCTGANNTAVGYEAGTANLGGFYNCFFGSWAGKAVTTGHSNNFFGYDAGGAVVAGLANVAIGQSAQKSNDVSNVVVIGYNAGQNNTANSLIAIGYQAGQNNATNNRLYINNSNSAFPLIYGEFDNDIVKFGNNSAAWNIQFVQSRIHMLETTTPTAIPNYGAIYTKADNKLYFQDGAGVEHEVAFV